MDVGCNQLHHGETTSASHISQQPAAWPCIQWKLDQTQLSALAIIGEGGTRRKGNGAGMIHLRELQVLRRVFVVQRDREVVENWLVAAIVSLDGS